MMYHSITQDPETVAASTAIHHRPLGLNRWQWWLLVAANTVFLLIGDASATILAKLYYSQGGASKWMVTLTQTAAFPILYLPLLLPNKTKNTSPSSPSLALLFLYFFIGLLLAGDNMLYSIGILNLPISTYTLISATQLVFNSIFSILINSQKFTSLVLNSVILLTLSACLVSIDPNQNQNHSLEEAKKVAIINREHAKGVLSTIGASAAYSLMLCLMQFSFEKVIKKETFVVVLEMQIYTSFVATCVCIWGLFGSGEWRGLKREMEGFGGGRVSYVLTLAGAAVAWQVSSVGVLGLIYLVSSLFSNVISMLSLPLAPVAAVILYGEEIDGVKVVAMLMAIWGFVSYLYQNYLDDRGDDSKVKEIDLGG